MEIIRELEGGPRGVYCGSIGYIRPDGYSCFNVGIRTATLSPDGNFVFNVGSGIVFDSEAKAEYEECLLKARFLERVIGRSA
jgi:anthranilate/para-aminobenzoate synthase component I